MPSPPAKKRKVVAAPEQKEDQKEAEPDPEDLLDLTGLPDLDPAFTVFREPEPSVSDVTTVESSVWQQNVPAAAQIYGPPAGPVAQEMVNRLIPSFQRQVALSARKVGRAELGRHVSHGAYGAMHMVSMGDGVLEDDKHFMKEIHGDTNMGRKKVDSKRRGPFRKRKGASRIMSRTAHVEIRKRNLDLEITVKRGVMLQEIHTLMGRLGLHRLSARETIIYLVVGGSQRSLGFLDTLDLDKLGRLLQSELLKRRSVGILLVDKVLGGALHRPEAHSGRFARATQKGETIHHRNF